VATAGIFQGEAAGEINNTNAHERTLNPTENGVGLKSESPPTLIGRA